jgi:hypothetical protein
MPCGPKPRTTESSDSIGSIVLRTAQRLVGSLYAAAKTHQQGRVEKDFTEWFEAFERLHGPLERRRSVDRDDLAAAYGIDGTRVDLPRLLWSIEVVSAAIIGQVGWHSLRSRSELHLSRKGLDEGRLSALSGVGGLTPPLSLTAGLELLTDGDWESLIATATRLSDIKRMDPYADIYRGLFHGLVPRRTRHALGAFFTPPWLAQFVLKASGYAPGARLVDPTCGSGVFLLEACRMLSHHVASGEVTPDEAQRCATKLTGQEINALSAFAARVNLLWTTPPPSSADRSSTPPTVVTGDTLLDRTDVLREGRFDVAVGNPPWVNWEHLPPDYRDATKDLWPPLGLFDHRGSAKAFSKEDVSVLFTYVTLAELLAPRSTLAFIVPASLFKSSMNARGFRRLQLGTDGPLLGIQGVHEFQSANAFDGAVGRPAVAVITRDQPTEYPARYTVRAPRDGHRIDKAASLETVERQLHTAEQLATPADPSDPQSPWMTLSQADLAAVGYVVGPSSYRARTGFFTGGSNGVFYLEILEDQDDLLLVRNVTARAKRFVQEYEFLIEPEFVYPLLQGREVHDWKCQHGSYALVPHDTTSGMQPVSPERMGETAPRTLEYLRSQREVLAQRRGFGGWEKGLLERAFYSVQRIGPYTFADYKVVWRYIAKEFTCCVVGPAQLFGKEKVVVPNEKVMLIAATSANEAYFVCGVLSASAVRVAINSRIIGTQISPSVISNIAIPQFEEDNPAHVEIARLCRTGHENTEPERGRDQLDHMVATLLQAAATDNRQPSLAGV